MLLYDTNIIMRDDSLLYIGKLYSGHHVKTRWNWSLVTYLHNIRVRTLRILDIGGLKVITDNRQQFLTEDGYKAIRNIKVNTKVKAIHGWKTVMRNTIRIVHKQLVFYPFLQDQEQEIVLENGVITKDDTVNFLL